MLPLVLGQNNVARPAYMEARAFGRDPNFFLRGLRTHEWKYVDSPTGTQPPQLYHLAVDPEEKSNVIANCPGVAKEMRKLLEAETSEGSPSMTGGGWTDKEASVVEERLRNLGYF
jgi:arylsulfatase A-like enzyme